MMMMMIMITASQRLPPVFESCFGQILYHCCWSRIASCACVQFFVSTEVDEKLYFFIDCRFYTGSGSSR